MNKESKTVLVLSLGFVGWLILLYGLRKIGMTSQSHQSELLATLLKQKQVSELMAKVLVYQSYHETGGFKSSLFINNNNPFGMKPAYIRQKDQSGSKNGYANYNTLDQAAHDLILWLDYNHFFTDYLPNFPISEDSFIVNYVDFLKQKRYFEDSQTNYLKGMLNAKNKLQL